MANSDASSMTVGRPYDSDQTMTEYARILSAVAIVAIVAYMTLGTTITSFVQNVVGCLSRKRSETVKQEREPYAECRPWCSRRTVYAAAGCQIDAFGFRGHVHSNDGVSGHRDGVMVG